MNKKDEEKCCRDCTHCIVYGGTIKYFCELTKKRDRVSGHYNYESCYDIIDTGKCNFKKSHVHLIVGVLTIIAMIGTCILQWFNS